MIYNTACAQCCEGAASRCRQRVVIELPTHTGLTTCCDVKRLWIFYVGSSLLITLTLVLIGPRANSNTSRRATTPYASPSKPPNRPLPTSSRVSSPTPPLPLASSMPSSPKSLRSLDARSCRRLMLVNSAITQGSPSCNRMVDIREIIDGSGSLRKQVWGQGVIM